MGAEIEKHREFVGQLKVMDTANPKIYRVQIMALNSEVNRNGWQYINLEQHLDEFRDIPILTAYVMGGQVIGDGHNYNMKRDPKTGEEYASFTASDAERIVGWVPKDANVRIENINGIDWVVLDAAIWRWYAKELVDQIALQGSSTSVSIETLVMDEREGEDGVEIEEKYVVLGITILGNGVEPAVAGANIRTLSELSELRSNMAENILKAASYAKTEESPKEAETSEPTNKNNEKGVKKRMTYLSRKELAELGKKFPDYKVLAAVQDENGGIRVCLMAKDASTSVYKMDSMDVTIVPENFRRVTAKVNFDIGEDCDNAEVDVCEMTEALAEECAAACENAASLECELNEAKECIKAMKKAENLRRVQAAKDKAKAVLGALNANRAAKAQFEESILDSINADIDAGKYTEKVNADGLWIGDAEVERDVRCACMIEQEKLDKKAREASETTFAYNTFTGNDNAEAPDRIEATLSELDKYI